MKNEQRKNILIGIFVTSTIVLGIYSVYLGNSLKNSRTELQEVKTILESNNNLSKNEDIKNEVTENAAEKEAGVEGKKEIETKIDLTKCLNAYDYQVFVTSTDLITSTSFFRIERISNHVKLNDEEEDIKNKVYFVNTKQNSKLGYYVRHELKGFNSEVKKILTLKIASKEDDHCYAVIFLMEDGTISCYDTREAYENNNFTVKNNFNDLKDIVDIQYLVVRDKENDGRYWAPYDTMAAVKEDGSFYDLRKFL